VGRILDIGTAKKNEMKRAEKEKDQTLKQKRGWKRRNQEKE